MHQICALKNDGTELKKKPNVFLNVSCIIYEQCSVVVAVSTRDNKITKYFFAVFIFVSLMFGLTIG